NGLEYFVLQWLDQLLLFQKEKTAEAKDFLVILFQFSLFLRDVFQPSLLHFLCQEDLFCLVSSVQPIDFLLKVFYLLLPSRRELINFILRFFILRHFTEDEIGVDIAEFLTIGNIQAEKQKCRKRC